MYLISLIIPIYNAEKYLENTINSVIGQSIGFNNIELILVDDNSKDNSRKIIEKYAKKYKNITTYFSNENHGFPGFGRNIGLKKSNAEFIMFMDNDDELDKDICKRLYESITTENADVVCCDKLVVDNISEIRKNINYSNGTEINNHVLIENDDILLFNNISVWNKIYRKKIITENEIRFLENTSADDFVFTILYFLKSKKLIYLKNYFGYYWNIRTDSLSHVVTITYIEEMLNINYYLLNILKKENKQHLAKNIFKENISYLIIQCSYLNTNKKEIESILKKIYEFEKEIEFSLKINNLLLDTINTLILKKKYDFAILLLKITKILRKSNTLRKIRRLL